MLDITRSSLINSLDSLTFQDPVFLEYDAIFMSYNLRLYNYDINVFHAVFLFINTNSHEHSNQTINRHVLINTHGNQISNIGAISKFA